MIYELDCYQKEAVFCDSKNTLVVAAPGSGKTTVIVNRLIYLIGKNKVAAENIVVITFTKMAAENMKNRYLGLSNLNSVPFFGTMHSFFYKILREYYKNIKIISEKEAFDLVHKVLNKYLEIISKEKVKEVLNNISLYKNSHNFEPTVDLEAFKECLKSYEEYKENNRLMDFDDLQLRCRDLFQKNKSILNRYRNKIKYLLIDEFQDCDELQIQIVKMLNINNYIFAVGDEDQSIYGFRGSEIKFMMDFTNIFGQSKLYFLSTNYRSPKNIVEVSNSIISNNLSRNNKKIEAKKTYYEKINIIISEDEDEEAKCISKTLKSLYDKDKDAYENTAILYRTNKESAMLADVFIKENIKFYFLDGEYNFFEHFICKDLIAYIRLSISSFDKESFIRIVNKPYRYISKLSIEKLKRENSICDIYDTLCSYHIMSLRQIRAVKDMEKKVNRLNKNSVADAVEAIWNRLLYKEYICSYSEKSGIDIDVLINIKNEFINYGKKHKNLECYLKHIEDIETTINSKRKNMEGVKLSTIHGVKGMEFKNVFIINCNEGNIPYFKGEQCNIEEERRLFYVAIVF